MTDTLSGVLVPWVTVPKFRLPGTSVTAGAGVKPVPVKEADSAGGAASSVMVSEAERTPAAEGVKEINREHEALG